MRTINVFLASSEELDNDRNAFGNLVRRLNKINKNRGICIELFEWEDYDAAYNDRRKQDEYNDEVRASDMFLALFHTKAGKYTIEEFDVASEEFRRSGIKPKCYVYCRDLQPGEEESIELIEFKRRLFDEMGHYWSRYNNRDSMQLHFVMQLQLVENSHWDDLEVEDGEVRMGEMTVARMENLRFAADNEDYQRMSQRLAELPEQIEKTRLKLDKHPDDEDYKKDLQKLIDEHKKLRKEFDQQQKFLFDTAKRIAQLHGERITDRMRRAMEAFDKGNVREANIILDEAEHDAVRNLADYRQSMEITEQKRQNVINSIDELLLKTSTIMADASIPIREREWQTYQLYVQVDTLANDIKLDNEKWINLLRSYAIFLNNISCFREALEIMAKYESLAIDTYVHESHLIARVYNLYGIIYSRLKNPDKSNEYLQKSLSIYEKKTEKYSLHIAYIYSLIGENIWKKAVDGRTNNPDKDLLILSLNLYKKAEKVIIPIKGVNSDAACHIYGNIGNVYIELGEVDKAREMFEKILHIKNAENFIDESIIASANTNIGALYFKNKDYDKALEWYLKALDIERKNHGWGHLDEAFIKRNIGVAYFEKKEYDKGRLYYLEALDFYANKLGMESPECKWINDEWHYYVDVMYNEGYYSK